jgi:hypothetical protein
MSRFSEGMIVILTTVWWVSKVRETLTVSKQPVNKMDMDKFNLKKLNEGEVKEWYQLRNKNRFSALESLDNNGDIYSVWYTIRKNIKMFAKESIGHCEVNCGLMRNVQTWLIEGSRLNCSGCRTQIY